MLNAEVCKCLWKYGVILIDRNKRIDVNLRCCLVRLEQYVEHLELQCSYVRNRVV